MGGHLWKPWPLTCIRLQKPFGRPTRRSELLRRNMQKVARAAARNHAFLPALSKEELESFGVEVAQKLVLAGWSVQLLFCYEMTMEKGCM
jgi:hypothetical protein